MQKKQGILAVLVIASATGSAMASLFGPTTPQESITFTNKGSVDAQNDVDNFRDTGLFIGGYTANAVRVSGTLTEVNTATFASEARVEITGPGGAPINLVQATTTGSFVGSLVIPPTDINFGTSFDPAGTVGFEWFESFQDGTAGLSESRWDTVTYQWLNRPIINGSANLGTHPGDGTTQTYTGGHVAGGLDFITVTIGGGGVGGLGSYLNLQTRNSAGGVAMDTEMAIYDAGGNLIAEDDDGQVTANGGLYSMMSFGTSDPLADPGVTGDTNPGEDGLVLAAGTYTIVTGGFNTVFTPLIAGITAGTSAGNYELRVTHFDVPEPASLGLLLGTAVLGLSRRRK